jgi:hypothetical protein
MQVPRIPRADRNNIIGLMVNVPSDYMFDLERVTEAVVLFCVADCLQQLSGCAHFSPHEKLDCIPCASASF